MSTNRDFQISNTNPNYSIQFDNFGSNFYADTLGFFCTSWLPTASKFSISCSIFWQVNGKLLATWLWWSRVTHSNPQPNFIDPPIRVRIFVGPKNRCLYLQTWTWAIFFSEWECQWSTDRLLVSFSCNLDIRSISLDIDIPLRWLSRVLRLEVQKEFCLAQVVNIWWLWWRHGWQPWMNFLILNGLIWFVSYLISYPLSEPEAWGIDPVPV